MKAIVEKDRRIKNDRDKIKDDWWNKMCVQGKLSAKQQQIISDYLDKIITMNSKEIMTSGHMAWFVSLIENFNFGTDIRHHPTRLMKAYESACDLLNEAYGHNSTNANGVYAYDGCGLEHLHNRLARYGVDFDLGDD